MKSVSITIEYYLDISWRSFWGLKIVGCNIFANSLMGTTIYDSSKKEKSDMS